MNFSCVADYRLAAKRRLPKFAFDYLDGAAEDGGTLRRNLTSFQCLSFRPRVLRDVTDAVTTASVLGTTYSAPLIVGPTGLNGLFWPRAEEILARVTTDAGLPFVLSSASTSLLEDVRTAAPEGNLWLQLYVQKDRRIAEDMLRRAKAAGYSTLLLTLDTPVHGKRDHDIRNGFRLPITVTPQLVFGAFSHPQWSFQMLRSGGPKLVNIASSMGEKATFSRQAAALSREMDMSLEWHDIDWLRRHWDGPILLKGIQTLEDARLAVKHAVDGIVLSNHGGRQLEGSLAPLELLPSVVDAVGGQISIFMDGGVRRGADAIKAMALGANGVLMGRAPLYGLSAAGEKGVRDVLRLIKEEMLITLRLLGCRAISDLNRSYLSADTKITFETACPTQRAH